MLGGHEVSRLLVDRFALTSCTPEQMQSAANLLAGLKEDGSPGESPIETTDDGRYLRKLGGGDVTAVAKMMEERTWNLQGRCLSDEDLEFLGSRATVGAANVQALMIILASGAVIAM